MRKISLLIGIALFCTACCTNNKKTNLNETASFADSTYNGQWAEKSVSYYVSMDGDIIFDKQYKDVNGNYFERDGNITLIR